MIVELTQALERAAALGASDILLKAGERVRVRIDGALRPVELYCPQDWLRALRKQAGTEADKDFGLTAGKLRCRVNVFRTLGTDAAALRLLPAHIPEFDDLGLPESLKALMARPRGLVLITGPTGSGKSTTLAAMIDWANRTRAAHILTIEDPVEYVHVSKKSAVTQREIGTDAPDFASALRSALREDPDIILIGEMRDAPTIQAALTAAETGHLVLSTTHTSGAARAVERIVSAFEDGQRALRHQLAGVLTAVISQQLIPKTGGGRVPAFEILTVNENVAGKIRDGDTHQIDGVIQTSSAEGMMLMDKSLSALAARGIVTRETAARYSVRRDEFEARIESI